MSRLAGLLAICLGCGVLVLRAQSPAPQQPPPFRGGVDVVQLDVSALDEKRRPVKGLTAADFAVIENGMPQPIVAFEAVDLPDAAALPAAWMRTAPLDVVTNDTGARRIFVIVFDDAHVPFDPAATKSAKDVANSVVDRLGPLDLAAVTFTDSGRSQNITADREQLRRAIDSFVPHPDLLNPAARGMPPFVPGRMATRRLASRPDLPPCARAGKYRSRAACVIDALVRVGDSLRTAPQGRKSLLFISAGPHFDFYMTDLRGADPPPGEEMTGIRAALKALQEANVIVHAVDPTGLTADGIMALRLDGLRMFAEDTGGRATIATNTPEQAVPQIFRENSSYYMLGIRAAGADAGRFHRVQVRVNRPGVEVRARNGYFSPSRETGTALADATPLDLAIGQVVPGGALPLGVALAPFALPDLRMAAVAVTTALRETLQPTAGETFELGVMALDARCGDCNKTLPSMRRRLAISPAGSGGSGTEFLSRLDLPPGRYEIRVAAELGGRTGSVFAHVDVPDYRKDVLSVSGLVLALRGVPAAPGEAMAGVLPVVPTAARELRPGAAVTAFLRLYQGGSKPPRPVGVTATIRDGSDRIELEQTRLVESASFSRTRASDFHLDLPLSTLESGPHLLTVEARLGDTAIRRHVRFSVR